MSSFEENVARLNANPAALEVLRGLSKEASLAGVLFDKRLMGAAGRVLGGTAAGTLLGGGLGAARAALQDEDIAAGARRGAIGGGALGLLGGSIHGAGRMWSGPGTGPNYAQVGAKLLERGAEGLGLAAGAAGAATLGVDIFGKGTANTNEAQQAAAKEVGRFEGMQQIKAQQLATLTPMHEQAFAEAHRNDEVLAGADPELMQSAYTTMKRFAPNLAADPNAVRSFLRESATWGTPPSYATLKNLADAEQSVTRAGGAL